MINNDYIFVSTGYLYSPWNGKLREYRGEVYHRDEIRNGPGGYIIPERTIFLVKDSYGRVLKSYDCSPNEGELYNKVVWLRDLDTRKAAAILIEYEEAQIAKFKLKIENHECMIDSLKGYLE